MRSRSVAVGAVVGVGLVVALALAFFVSPWASSQPDGLNRVAIDKGFAETETDHALGEGPLAGYETKGVTNERLTTGVAGIIGVTVTFVLGLALFLVMKALRGRSSPPADLVAGGMGMTGGQAGP